MELKDYYFILGVPRTATARDILRAYRELAKLYHPDRAGAQGTASFQEIVEAYEVLSNPERRRHYNHSLSEFVEITPSPSPVGSARNQPEPLIPEQRGFRLHSQPEPLVPEPMSILHDFGTIRSSVEALRDHLLHNFTGLGTSKSAHLARLNVEVQLSPYEALQGVIVPIGIPVYLGCPVCGGSGRDWFSPCLACRGQGMAETERTVHIRIPPQVREGTVFEASLRDWGMQNVYLRLHIRIV